MPKEFQKFVVSQKGMIMLAGKCLIVRLREEIGHPSSLKWDLPGGRIDEGEDGEEAFKREMLEETGLKKYSSLGLADYFIRYPEHKFYPPYCGFIRLLEIDKNDVIKLSKEHIELKWIEEDEIKNFNFCWKKMPEMIKKGFEMYKKIKS